MFPACLQTYFYNPEEQVQQRAMRLPKNMLNNNHKADIFRILHGAFKTAKRSPNQRTN